MVSLIGSSRGVHGFVQRQEMLRAAQKAGRNSLETFSMKCQPIIEKGGAVPKTNAISAQGCWLLASRCCGHSPAL